jgi:hypothetical protein
MQHVVTMDNITYAYDQAAMGNGFMEEFAATPEEISAPRSMVILPPVAYRYA